MDIIPDFWPLLKWNTQDISIVKYLKHTEI